MASISRGFICEPDLLPKLENGQKRLNALVAINAFQYLKQRVRVVFHEDYSMK
jgi:hypothetical protein